MQNLSALADATYKDDKPFWVSCKHYFSNKHSKADNEIVLNEDGELILKNKEIANTFNDYFGSIVENLNLEHQGKDSKNNLVIIHGNNFNDIIKKCVNHPGIKNIKKKYKNINKFSFCPVTADEVKKVIKHLKTNKSVGGEIPLQILKESEFTFECLKNCINHSVEEIEIFPSSLKLGNITPIFKKDDPLDKSNYRPVSILPLLSKVYERIIYNQLSQHSEQFLNSILCGFRKAHNTQHPLFKLLHSWQRELDSGGFVGTILMDLSKAYDCISHELLIAKLECYGLDEISLKLILNYLSHRKQRTKIGSSFSSWFDIYIGDPQGSILGMLLFIKFINDLFLNVIK